MMPSRPTAPKSRPKRWLALLLASAVLHGTVLQLAGGQVGMPAPASAPPASALVTVQLQQRQTAAPDPVAAAPQPRPKPKPKPRPQPAAAPAEPGPVAPAASAAAPSEAAFADDMAGMEVPGSSIEPAVVLAPDAASAAHDGAGSRAQAAAAQQQTIDPPPSALLKYDVQSSKEGRAVYGSGKIAWHTDGTGYTISGEASVLLFTVLEFRSEGELDRFGVAPLLYTEKRLRKPATNTHFQREPQIISFSASTLSYPRQGGAQDRASIVWQLAALGRGDGSLFAPGAQLEVTVAGVRDAETWRIRVIGLEQIRIPAGEMQAWHLERQPRAASFDQKIDIWLAPQQQWYPVRLRYTEKNGDYLDMAAAAIEPVAQPAARY